MVEPEPGTIHVELSGRIDRNDLTRLTERFRRALEAGGSQAVVCDVATLGEHDAVTVDALARFQVTARRLGCQMRLRDASPDLRALLRLMGLRDVLPVATSGVEMRGQPKEREVGRRIQEEGDPGDPIA